MKQNILKLIIGCGVLALLATGCEQGDQAESIDKLLVGQEKIYFDEAELEQIIPHKVACPGNPHDKKVCIQICHVPPGNHDNAHDKVLPIQAMKAHIGHGDYLGLCDGQGPQDPPDEEQPPGEEEQPPGDDQDPIPNWCIPYFEIDSNCDGIDDGAEEPYF